MVERQPEELGVGGSSPSPSTMENENLKVGDVCPHCKDATLDLVKEDFPYNIDHLQCPNCDSTYNLDMGQ